MVWFGLQGFDRNHRIELAGLLVFLLIAVIPVSAETTIDAKPSFELMAQAGSGSNSQYNTQYASQYNQAPRQINRLDQEILILRAEMAKRRGEWPQLKHYLSILDKQPILPEFVPRVEQLKQFQTSQSPLDKLLSFFGVSSSPQFPMYDKDAVVAIVLPLSGVYEKAGEPLSKAIKAGLSESGFAGKLVIIDSAIYDSAYDIWNTLKYYQPDFVFGPMQKQMVSQWQLLDTEVSTLYFNEVPQLGSKEYALAPSKLVGLEQLFQLINDNAYQRVMVISDDSDQAQRLKNSFQQAWNDLQRPFYLESYQIDKNVGVTLDQAFQMQSSRSRALWVENSVSRNIEFDKRARQDIELVISFVAQEQAIQIAPYLHYLPIPSVYTHIWYPSHTPNLNYLLANLNAMPQTLAVLPFYFNSGNTLTAQDADSENKIGLFYALGRVAVEIVRKTDLSGSVDSLVNTEFGSYVRNSQGQFHLLPTVYWLNEAKMQKLSSISND